MAVIADTVAIAGTVVVAEVGPVVEVVVAGVEDAVAAAEGVTEEAMADMAGVGTKLPLRRSCALENQSIKATISWPLCFMTSSCPSAAEQPV